jgi:hypothetical protein
MAKTWIHAILLALRDEIASICWHNETYRKGEMIQPTAQLTRTSRVEISSLLGHSGGLLPTFLEDLAKPLMADL